jgi:acyl-CoA synthetase (AMP-forming)/AMP-acid ligase II
MHSYHSILSAAKQLVETIGQDQHCVSGVTLPICHIAGFIGQVITTILVGGKIILFPKFDSAMLVQAIQKYNITHLEMVPVNLIALVEFIAAHGGDVKSLRCVMVGGDKVSENIQEKFFALTGCHITEVMGMTESFSHCINLSHDLSKRGSFGQAAKGATVTLMDEQDQPILKKNSIGEVVIQSEANMIGYWNNTAETEKTLRNGSVYSGDLAYQDSHHYFWFVGRKKNLIIRGGSNISPQEIENVLMTHPFISEVCVIGVPDKTFNQIVCACVVLHDKNTLLTLNDIRIFCQDKLSEYKIPEKLITVKELPHNATGKIDRKKTAEKFGKTYLV